MGGHCLVKYGVGCHSCDAFCVTISFNFLNFLLLIIMSHFYLYCSYFIFSICFHGYMEPVLPPPYYKRTKTYRRSRWVCVMRPNVSHVINEYPYMIFVIMTTHMISANLRNTVDVHLFQLLHVDCRQLVWHTCIVIF